MPVRANQAPLTIAGRTLPVTWRQVGKTVALSAAAVAAEVGLAWLRRRIDAPGAAAPLARAENSSTAQNTAPPSITIISQRIVEILDQGDGKRVINVQLEGSHRPMQLGLAWLKEQKARRVVEAFMDRCRAIISNEYIPGMTAPGKSGRVSGRRSNRSVAKA